MSKTIFTGDSNPIFSFITQPTIHDQRKVDTSNLNEPLAVQQRTGVVSSKKRIQENRKTKRLNLLIQPSLHETLTKIACIKQTSVNAIIIEASKEYCSKEVRALEKYERTFGKEAEEV